MASRNRIVGTGVALAGISGIAVAAITAEAPADKAQVTTVAQPVETRTVVIRKVEHRVRRVKPKRHRHAATAARVATPAQLPVVQQAPVVQSTPVVQQSPARSTAPVRTRTSGSSGRSGDDAGEHEHEFESHESEDDGAERNDD
jgi:hypothetical protein